MRRPSGGGDVSSNTVSSVSNAARASASCRLNASLNRSMTIRVASAEEFTGIGVESSKLKGS